MALSTGINPFFISYGYNTPLLNFDITAANTKDRDTRTPAKIREKITRKLREAFNFAQAIITYAQDI